MRAGETRRVGGFIVNLEKSDGCIIQQFIREWADKEEAGGVFRGKRKKETC